jgi:hypothetical protein
MLNVIKKYFNTTFNKLLKNNIIATLKNPNTFKKNEANLSLSF